MQARRLARTTKINTGKERADSYFLFCDEHEIIKMIENSGHRDDVGVLMGICKQANLDGENVGFWLGQRIKSHFAK